MTADDLLVRLHELTHKVAGDGYLLAQDIKEHLKHGAGHEDIPLVALLPCLEEFIRTAHALADLDGEAWPSWWPENWGPTIR